MAAALGARRFRGGEGAEEAVDECGGALKTEWRRRTGAGSREGGTAARPRGEEEGGRWRLKEHLTCGSHMSGREREGEEAGGAGAEMGRLGPKVGWAAGWAGC
jgi:hypothetical protein